LILFDGLTNVDIALLLEQRRQKLAEHLLRRKTMFACKQENKIAR
jgi:hypothetical protein